MRIAIRFFRKSRHITIVLLAVLLISTRPHDLKIAGKHPNILFIAVDDLKPTLGCYGDTLAKTPNIDALASSGVTFMHNYCQQAVCAPSRASLLTGQYPDQLKVWDLQTVIRELNPGITTLPQYFKNNGYQTAATGKIFDPRSLEGSWGGPHDAPSWSIDYTYPGDFYSTEYGSPEYYYASDYALDTIGKLQSEAQRKGFNSYNEIRNFVSKYYWPPVEKAEVPYDAYIDGALANHGIHLMETMAADEQPFFLAVGFNRPHLPFNAPAKYWEMYDRDDFTIAAYQQQAVNSPDLAYHNSGELRNGYTGVPSGNFPVEYQKELIHGYYAAVSYIDDMIGKLLQKLDDLALAENTIVVLWGDHGWHLGDHGLWCKHSNFEHATKAPLVMRSPAQMIKGGKHFGPTEFTDIAPTLCELAGLKVPVYFEGENLSPLFDNPGLDLRMAALSQYPRNNKDYMGYSLRTKRYRYTKWIEISTGKTEAAELYDYEVDPLETKSFVNDPTYDSIIHVLDSIVNERINVPSTQMKMHYYVKAKDEDGNVYSLPNCIIHLDGFEIATNDSGYAFVTHPKGTYKVQTRKKGFVLKTSSIYLNGDTVLYDTLSPKINQVAIKLLDSESSKFVDSCKIWLDNVKVEQTTDSLIKFHELVSGHYMLTIEKAHYETILNQKLFIYSDSIIQIRLKKKQYLVEFNITDDYTKKNVSGVHISIGNNHEITGFSGFADLFLPYNVYNINYQKDQYESLSGKYTISKDTCFFIEMHKSSGNIAFNIRDGTTPVNNVSITLMNDSLVTNNLGMVEFKNLPFNQTYGYTISKPDYEEIQQQITFVYDTTLEFQLYPSTFFQTKQTGISVYPNPVKTHLFISSLHNIDAIYIYDLFGRTMHSINAPQKQLYVSVVHLPKGIYTVKIVLSDRQAYTEILTKSGS